MTEAEWFAASEPLTLRRYFGIAHTAHCWRAFAHRKMILFSVACCRRLCDTWPDPRIRLAVDTAEQYCDARTNHERAIMKPVRVAIRGDLEWARSDFGRLAKAVTGTHGWDAAWRCSWEVGLIRGGLTEQAVRERMAQMPLLRDIIGNPFRPPRFSSKWRTADVVLLAQQMYELRDFSAMPILADALQDAGCDSDTILNHCRDTDAPHVRGCWAVDLVLGKS